MTSILTLGRTFGPQIAKTLGLSAVAGLASEGASQVVKKISGGSQTGGFIIPLNKIDQLIPYKHLLTTKQTQDLLKGIQTGSAVPLKLNKTQQGGFLGTLLASIGVPLAIEAFKRFVGSGGPRMGKPPVALPKDGGSSPRVGLYQPPPFIGDWPDKTLGTGGKKKKQQQQKKKTKRGEGLLLGANSPLKNVPLLNILF